MLFKTLARGLALASLFMTLPTYAANFLSSTPGSLQTIRALGLGEAVTAVADDQMALYYNPAGLARLNGWSLEVLNIAGGLNEYTTPTAFMGLAKDFSNAKDTPSKINVIQNQLGRNFYTRFMFNPYIVKPGFGLAAMEDFELNAAINSPKDNFVDLVLRSDTDLRAGVAIQLFNEKLALGVAGAFRNRILINGDIGLDKLTGFLDKSDGRSTIDKLKDMGASGAGVGWDLGMLLTPWETWKPTLGVSVLNFADTILWANRLGKTIANEEAAPLPQSVNAGISLTPTVPLGWFGTLFGRASLDMRDINLPLPASHKWRLGLEGGWDHLATAQLGYSEGSWTAGFEIRMYIINLRFATYKVERGYYAGDASERRYLAGFKFLLDRKSVV